MLQPPYPECDLHREFFFLLFFDTGLLLPFYSLKFCLEFEAALLDRLYAHIIWVIGKAALAAVLRFIVSAQVNERCRRSIECF